MIIIKMWGNSIVQYPNLSFILFTLLALKTKQERKPFFKETKWNNAKPQQIKIKSRKTENWTILEMYPRRTRLDLWIKQKYKVKWKDWRNSTLISLRNSFKFLEQLSKKVKQNLEEKLIKSLPNQWIRRQRSRKLRFPWSDREYRAPLGFAKPQREK